jgi:hypothetical protein
MIKKALIRIAYSVLLTVVIVTVLFLTKGVLLDRLVHLIMKIRGTTEYEGEEKGTEVWNIIAGIIIPATFLFTLIIVILFSRKNNKK